MQGNELLWLCISVPAQQAAFQVSKLFTGECAVVQQCLQVLEFANQPSQKYSETVSLLHGSCLPTPLQCWNKFAVTNVLVYVRSPTLAARFAQVLETYLQHFSEYY